MEADNIKSPAHAVAAATKVKSATSQVKDGALSVMFTDLLRGTSNDLQGRMGGLGEGFREDDDAMDTATAPQEQPRTQADAGDDDEPQMDDAPRRESVHSNDGGNDYGADDAPPPARAEHPQTSGDDTTTPDEAAPEARASGNTGDNDASDQNPNTGETTQTTDAAPTTTGEAVVADTTAMADAAASLANDTQTTGPAHAETVLSALLAAKAGASTAPQKAAEQAESHSNGQNGATTDKGLNQALARVGENLNRTGQTASGPMDGMDGGETDVGEELAALLRGTAQKKTTATGPQTARTDHTGATAKQGDNTAATTGDAKAAQAAQLTKTLAGTGRTQINVTVTDEAETLVSKPTQTSLAPTPVLTPNKPATTPTQTAQTNVPTQSDAAAQALQAAQTQAAQAQAAAQATATQATAKAAAGTATQAISGGAGTSGADGTAPSMANTQNTAQPQKAAAQPTPQPRQQAFQQTVINQVSVQIAKAAGNAADRISIQLKPAHLGRIDVQMEMGTDGRIQAVVTADNKDTLNLLQKDSAELEKALKDAGLNADKDSLSFSLKEQNQQAAEGDGGAANGSGEDALADDAGEDTTIAAGDDEFISGNIFKDGRVDIRA